MWARGKRGLPTSLVLTLAEMPLSAILKFSQRSLWCLADTGSRPRWAPFSETYRETRKRRGLLRSARKRRLTVGFDEASDIAAGINPTGVATHKVNFDAGYVCHRHFAVAGASNFLPLLPRGCRFLQLLFCAHCSISPFGFARCKQYR